MVTARHPILLHLRWIFCLPSIRSGLGCLLIGYASTMIKHSLSGSALGRGWLAKRDIHQLQAVSEALTSDDSVRNLGSACGFGTEVPWTHFEIEPELLLPVASYAFDPLLTISKNGLVLTLAHAFICSRVDFCNRSVLWSSSSYLLDGLQSIMNATARLILIHSQSIGHISEEIRTNLHWLPVRQRINYKVCYLVRNCLAGAALEYLSEVCQSTSSVIWSSTPSLCTSKWPSGASA